MVVNRPTTGPSVGPADLRRLHVFLAGQLRAGTGPVTGGGVCLYYWATGTKPDDLPAFRSSLPLAGAQVRPGGLGVGGEMEVEEAGPAADHPLGSQVSHRLPGLWLPPSGRRAGHPSDAGVLGSALERYGPQVVDMIPMVMRLRG